MLNLVEWGILPGDFLLSPFFFVGRSRGKTHEWKCTHKVSKHVKLANFGVFVKKWSPPPPPAPKISKILHYKSRYSLKARKTLGVSTPKICGRIGTADGAFKFWVKNLTGSGILVVSAHAQQKIG